MAQLQLKTDVRSTESELICRALRKDEAAIRSIVQAHNLRLYRVARSIVRDDGEAEDVVQEAYLHAFRALEDFRGDASLATWLTRIVLNEALQRRRRRTQLPVEWIDEPRTPEVQIIAFPISGSQSADPERTTAQREICRLLERAIDELPEELRIVLVARAIDGMSIDETANLLGLLPATVKTRLHRARCQLRASLVDHIESDFGAAFPFAGKRCERIADAVVKRLNPTG